MDSTGDSNGPGGFPGMPGGFPGMAGMPGMPGGGFPGMNMEMLQQFMQASRFAAL